jgi:hypothetical protein
MIRVGLKILAGYHFGYLALKLWMFQACWSQKTLAGSPLPAPQREQLLMPTMVLVGLIAFDLLGIIQKY